MALLHLTHLLLMTILAKKWFNPEVCKVLIKSDLYNDTQLILIVPWCLYLVNR